MKSIVNFFEPFCNLTDWDFKKNIRVNRSSDHDVCEFEHEKTYTHKGFLFVSITFFKQ